MSDYSPAVFEEHIGRVFEFERSDLQQPADRVQLQLVEVSGAQARVARPGFREPFSLLFVLRGDARPGPGLHRIAHQDFESCDWFLNRVTVPDRDLRQAYYQAVFG